MGCIETKLELGPERRTLLGAFLFFFPRRFRL